MLSNPIFGGELMPTQNEQHKADWRIGLAKAKITPEEPIPLAGYAHRTGCSEGVASDLFLKAMAFEDSDGTRALLITADVIGFADDEANEISRRIGEKTGLAREAILLNGSHTHSGPIPIGRRADWRPEAKEVVERYVEQLVDVAASTAIEALSEMRPARLSWGVGVAKFVMNRREFTDKGVKLGCNPRGPADRSVPVLRVDGEDGELRAVLFGAAGHNVTNDNNWLMIDGDYAGYAQTRVEEQRPGAQAMFMLGCAGDANIFSRGSNELAREHGHTLGAEVLRVLDGDLRPVRGPLRTALERVDLPLRVFESREEIEKMADGAPKYLKFFTDHALKMLDRGESLPTHFNAPFAMWQFGDDLTLLGLSGETLIDYALLAEQTIGPLRLWVAGYCNSLFGYLPSPHVLEEGGYETRGLYVDVGLFSPETYGVVGGTIERLARKARPGK
jgi:neutral ceramidase